MNPDRSVVVKILRSIIISSPQNGKSIRDLVRDYHEQEGTKIPIYEHRTVEDFLRSTGEFIIENYRGELKVYEKPNSDSSHIAQLVSEQNKPKKRSSSASNRGRQPMRPINHQPYRPAIPNRSPTKSIFPRQNVNNTRPTPAPHQRNQAPTTEYTFGQLKSQQMQNNRTVIDLTNQRTPTEKLNIKNQSDQPKPSADLRIRLNQKRFEKPPEECIDLTIDSPPRPSHSDNRSVKKTPPPVSPKKSEPNQQLKDKTPSPVKTPPINGQAAMLPNNPFLDMARMQERWQNQSKLDSHRIVNRNVYVTNERKSVNDRLATARLHTIDLTKSTNDTSTEYSSTPTPVTPNSPTVPSYEIRLFDYCKEKGLSVPKFKIFKIDNRFQCHVTIDNIPYSSYPTDYADQIEARVQTSKYALDRLVAIQQRQKCDVCMDNEAELANKIYVCIQDCKTGVFSKKIPEKFVSMYGKVLPTGWMNILAKHPECFTIEECIQDHIICVVEAAELDIKMEKLQLPWSEEYWSLIITCAVSTNEVWGRLIGNDHSTALDSLVNDIEMDFLKNKQSAKTFVVGEIYLVMVNACAYRVRVEKVDEGRKQCLCFGVDEGDRQWYNMDEMYVCQNKFLKLAPQAIRFALHGMEEFDDNKFAKKHLEDTLLNAPPLIGQIFTKKEDFLALEESSDSEAIVQVVLYDTSTSEDINLNEKIISEVCHDIPAPELPHLELKNVSVSHISDNGNIFIQLEQSGVHYINKLIHKITQSSHSNKPLPATNQSSSDLYLVYDDETRRWCRGRLINETKNIKANDMFFVDYGKTKSVPFDKTHRLDSLSPALFTFPPQAMEVKVKGLVDFPKHYVQILRGYFAGDTSAFVMKMNVTGIPEVKLYYYKDNVMINVEDRIESELKHPQASETSFSRQSSVSSITGRDPKALDELSNFKNLTVSTSRKLPKLQPPKVSDYFDVEVVMAASPSNFQIRPIKYMRQWVQQMKSLQDYCKNSRDLEMIQENETYACLHSDGQWYRATVAESLGSKFIVKYCDIGDLDSIDDIKRFRTLPNEYRDLPKMAIKARLYGIQPIDVSGWDMNDTIQFGQLVTGKKFQAVIGKIIENENPDENAILEIQLIDVSTEYDVCINDNFVSSGRALNIFTY